jgi:hypothetical protein
MGERRGVGYLKDKDNLEDSSVNRRTILRWVFRKWDGGRHGLE